MERPKIKARHILDATSPQPLTRVPYTPRLQAKEGRPRSRRDFQALHKRTVDSASTNTPRFPHATIMPPAASQLGLLLLASVLLSATALSWKRRRMYV